jgi:hypothetical protein
MLRSINHLPALGGRIVGRRRVMTRDEVSAVLEAAYAELAENGNAAVRFGCRTPGVPLLQAAVAIERVLNLCELTRLGLELCADGPIDAAATEALIALDVARRRLGYASDWMSGAYRELEALARGG